MAAGVGLRWSADADVAVVGPVTGRAELAVSGTDAASAIALVDALVEPGPDRRLEPGSASRLAVADRDRVLVQVHLDLYGESIVTTLTCRGCGERFDLDFRLDALAAHCRPTQADPGSAGPPWRVGDLEFRPLTGDDELAVLGEADPAGALFRRVTAPPTPERPVSAPAGDEVREEVAAALARLTPPVAAPIGAVCPECEAQQSVEFDVQGFLLARILGERPRLWRSVHLIAAAYHWSRREILDLSRPEREAYADAVLASTPRVRSR